MTFCSWIDDDDLLLDVSKSESAVTHYQSLVKQVVGVVNSTCQPLLRNTFQYNANQSAFLLSRLELGVLYVKSRYNRSSQAFQKPHSAYAPTVLNVTLNYVSKADNTMETIRLA